MLHQHSNKILYLRIRTLAREMRKNPTLAEEFFWEKVRDRRFFGFKWSRQFIIQCWIDSLFTKYYIADFHCYRYKLVIELDGQIHLRQLEEDLLRTEQIEEWGYTVLRFTNEQVLHHWEEVEKSILQHIKKCCR